MLHNLTIGYLDTTLVAERGSRVLKPLENRVVEKHLAELGQRDGEDWTLGDGKVEFRNGCLIVPRMGGRTNRISKGIRPTHDPQQRVPANRPRARTRDRGTSVAGTWSRRTEANGQHPAMIHAECGGADGGDIRAIPSPQQR